MLTNEIDPLRSAATNGIEWLLNKYDRSVQRLATECLTNKIDPHRSAAKNEVLTNEIGPYRSTAVRKVNEECQLQSRVSKRGFVLLHLKSDKLQDAVTHKLASTYWDLGEYKGRAH